MAVELKQAIINHLGENVGAVGFAPIDRFNNAPEMHHPANTCQDARTVIVFGITEPQGMLRSPDYNLYLLYRWRFAILLKPGENILRFRFPATHHWFIMKWNRGGSFP